MERRFLTNADCAYAACGLYKKIYDDIGVAAIYGVPRGGVTVAHMVARFGYASGAEVVDDWEAANVIVDDIVDSGATRSRYMEMIPNVPFYALTDFLRDPRQPKQWIVFPWESRENEQDTSAEDIVVRLLQRIGEDPKRGGLLETPARVIQAWDQWTAGYKGDPAAILKCFEDGGENYDQMIVVKDLPFYSFCEHHLASFFGTATIAYIPDKRVVGLSKLGRVLDIYARRLQIQERLTTQVADAIQDNLKPKGVGVLVKARHLCMESRGLSKQGHLTITSALRGDFLTHGAVRQEFLSIAQ